MKIRVNENPKIEETEVIINCKQIDQSINEIKTSLDYLNKIITVKIDGRNYTLSLNEIYYFESVDNKVFAYSKDKVYEASLKLYELEDIYKNTPLIRINKNTVLNTRKIRSFKSSLNGRMEAVLKNKEIVIISRKYVPILKSVLGGRE